MKGNYQCREPVEESNGLLSGYKTKHNEETHYRTKNNLVINVLLEDQNPMISIRGNMQL